MSTETNKQNKNALSIENAPNENTPNENNIKSGNTVS